MPIRICPTDCAFLTGKQKGEDYKCTFDFSHGKDQLLFDHEGVPVRYSNCFEEGEVTQFYKTDVFNHQNSVYLLIEHCISILKKLANEHDQSKLTEVEVISYKYPVWELNNRYPKPEFGSPAHKELTGMMGAGWKHHLDNNPHHIAHHKNGLKDMNLFLIIEMLCDWIAASERDGGVFDIEKSLKFSTVKKDNESIPVFDEVWSNVLRNTAKEVQKLRNK